MTRKLNKINIAVAFGSYLSGRKDTIIVSSGIQGSEVSTEFYGFLNACSTRKQSNKHYA